jgi:hypothetical protein
MSFMPLSVASTVICHETASIPKFTLRSSGAKHREGEILENNNRLIDV